jgi:hypothetical protein
MRPACVMNRFALLERQLQGHEPFAALDPEQIRARRLALQSTLQHGMDLVLRPRARAHQLLAASKRRRRIRQRSSGIHTLSSSPFHSKLANARASSLSVFARALASHSYQGSPPQPG